MLEHPLVVVPATITLITDSIGTGVVDNVVRACQQFLRRILLIDTIIDSGAVYQLIKEFRKNPHVKAEIGVR